ncbi:MAG: PP2C family protein-serine/threonine phosphatase [Fusobacteriota bacterium]
MNIVIICFLTVGILFLIKQSLIKEKRFIKKRENLEIGKKQYIGSRKNQEDSLSIIKNENGRLAIVADGMGGYNRGEKASNMAVKTFMEEFTKKYHMDSIIKFLINSAYIANQKILEFANGEQLGTTLVTTFIKDDRLYWASVGDSQIYLYRDEELKKLNVTHTYERKLKKDYRAKKISRKDYISHPQKDRLTSYLGYEDFHEIDYNKVPIELKKNDKIVLCSDGVSDAINHSELENILNKRETPENLVDEILKRIEDKNRTNQDNASIIIFEKK